MKRWKWLLLCIVISYKESQKKSKDGGIFMILQMKVDAYFVDGKYEWWIENEW